MCAAPVPGALFCPALQGGLAGGDGPSREKRDQKCRGAAAEPGQIPGPAAPAGIHTSRDPHQPLWASHSLQDQGPCSCWVKQSVLGGSVPFWCQGWLSCPDRWWWVASSLASVWNWITQQLRLRALFAFSLSGTQIGVLFLYTLLLRHTHIYIYLLLKKSDNFFPFYLVFQ